MRRTLTMATVIAAGAFLLTAPQLLAARLPAARIFIEFNFTDQDIGAHVFLDGPGWRTMKIFDPKGVKIFDVTATGSMGMIGLSEMFFEGEEPSLDELPLDQFKQRFPEGNYRFEGQTVDGKPLGAMAKFTHNIPDAAVILSPAEGAVVDPANAVITWGPVSNVVAYQVIVGDFQVTLPATDTSVTVPPEYLEPGTRYGFEVLSIEAGANQTISSSFFVTQ